MQFALQDVDGAVGPELVREHAAGTRFSEPALPLPSCFTANDIRLLYRLLCAGDMKINIGEPFNHMP